MFRAPMLLSHFCWYYIAASTGIVGVICLAVFICIRLKWCYIINRNYGLYNELSENTNTIMIVAAAENGVILNANSAACSFYGYSKERFIGSSISIICSGGKSATAREIEHIRSGRFSCFNSCHIVASGEERNVEVCCFPTIINKTKASCLVVHDRSEYDTLKKQLKEERKRYKMLMNSAADAVFLNRMIDEYYPGRFVLVNEAACRMTGYSREELLKLSPFDIVYDIMSGEFIKSIGSISIRSSVTFEGMLIGKNGNGIPVEFNSYKFIMDGETLVLSMIRDITKRKKVESSLKESEELFRGVVDNIPVGICVADRELKVKLWNSAQEKMTGIPAHEIIGCSAGSRISDFSGSELESFCQRVMETGEVLSLKEYKCKIPFSPQRNYYINVNACPIKGNSKASSGILIAVEDITENVETGNALRRSEERYRRLVEFLPDAVFVSTDGKIVFVNAAGLNMLKALDDVEIIGKPFEFFLCQDSAVKHESIASQMVDGAKIALSVEEKLVGLDGEVIEAEISAISFPYTDGAGVLLVVRDITERKHNEELRRKFEENSLLLQKTLEYDKLKSEFLANISHEVRTPLNLILSTIQLSELNLKDGLQPDSAKIIRHFAIIKHNCYRLLRLITNLMDITRIDSGFLELNMENYDIVNIIEELVHSTAEYIKGWGIKIEMDTDVEEKIILCDIEKIEKIMLNLISNAVKFSKDGGTISVNIHDNVQTLSISVKDNGAGIPEDKIGMVFDRFRQVDRLLTRNHEGSGIGLSLVKSLVEMHGGSIQVKSRYGYGSEFIVELPAKSTYEGEYIRREDAARKREIMEKINIEFSDIYC